jgi:hypothetical protein
MIEKTRQKNQQEELPDLTDSESEPPCWSVYVVAPTASYPFSRLRAVLWSHLVRRGPFLESPKMQRNQRISSRSAIPTRERLVSRERESAWQNLRGRRAGHDSLLYCEIPRHFSVKYRAHAIVGDVATVAAPVLI